jgi:hypothetical protein
VAALAAALGAREEVAVALLRSTPGLLRHAPGLYQQSLKVSAAKSVAVSPRDGTAAGFCRAQLTGLPQLFPTVMRLAPAERLCASCAPIPCLLLLPLLPITRNSACCAFS